MEVRKSKLILEKTLKIYTWVIVAIFLVMFVRVAWLQIIKTELYRTKAVSNIMRWLPETAPRGEILDRNGQVLATNRPVFNLCLDYMGMSDEDGTSQINSDEVVNRLVEILDDPEITYEQIQNMIKSQSGRLYEPVIIKRDIPIELVTVFEERRRELPGVSIIAQPQRSYPHETLAGHLLGYVHSIKEELEEPGFEDYGMADLVGKTGIEKVYEHDLRGENGYRQVEVTALNRPVREVQTIPAIPGNDLILTIDLELQRVMEKSFDEVLEKVQKDHPKAQAGAAVLLDVKTGKVLAMTSRPELDPTDFNGNSLSQEQADYYFSNEPPALRNRALQGAYVPGSTFKMVTAIAALESGVVSPDEYLTCTGRYWESPYIKCWDVHGSVNLYSALAKSCNVYFQEMAARSGIEAIGRIGTELGLGQRTGIDLPYESSGLLPHLEWQEKEFGARADRINKQIDERIKGIEDEYQKNIEAAADESEKKRLERELSGKINVWEQERKIQLNHYTRWHTWDTYNTGIGQGYNQYSVIQLANYVSTIANGGTRYKPYIVDRIISYEGEVLKQYEPELVLETSISADTIREVQRGMQAVTEPGGTAYFLFSDFPEEIKVGAKTGTAQTGRADYEKDDYDGLFVAFAPADNPQIAFAGVVEHGYSGGGSAGYIAKALMEEYFGIGQEKSILELSEVEHEIVD